MLIHNRGDGPLKVGDAARGHSRARRALQVDATKCLDADLPLYMNCKCSSNRAPVNAQLSRLQIVTPKAPIGVRLNPHVKVSKRASANRCNALHKCRISVRRLGKLSYGSNGGAQLGPLLYVSTAICLRRSGRPHPEADQRADYKRRDARKLPSSLSKVVTRPFDQVASPLFPQCSFLYHRNCSSEQKSFYGYAILCHIRTYRLNIKL